MINTTPTVQREEVPVRSSVYLRNQNQSPVAVISSSVVASSPRTVLLNASGSSDYEGRTLQHFWFLNTMPNATSIRCDQAAESNVPIGPLWGGNFIGRGITYRHQWLGTSPASGTAQTVGLVSCDPGDRFGVATPKTVNIP